MTRTSDIESEEKSMAELLIIVVVIGVLMASFIRYFFKQENNITDAGYQALANNFASQVQSVHAQWLMDGQPSVVVVKEVSGKKTAIAVNQQGWIASENCHGVWQQVMDMPLEFLKQPISVIELITNNQQSSAICRFAISENVYFDYHLSSGKVVSN